MYEIPVETNVTVSFVAYDKRRGRWWWIWNWWWYKSKCRQRNPRPRLTRLVSTSHIVTIRVSLRSPRQIYTVIASLFGTLSVARQTLALTFANRCLLWNVFALCYSAIIRFFLVVTRAKGLSLKVNLWSDPCKITTRGLVFNAFHSSFYNASANSPVRNKVKYIFF